jgi:hypothetical protein
MQDKIAQKEDVYTNSLLLGNAFYNITYFGNGRTFYEISISSNDSGTYSCDISKMYYKKAFDAAATKEQKAKCIYMIAKCERNDYYNTKYKNVSWWERQDDKVNFIAWEAFKTLNKEYSDTKYYQDVIAECGYFNTYVNQ